MYHIFTRLSWTSTVGSDLPAPISIVGGTWAVVQIMLTGNLTRLLNSVYAVDAATGDTALNISNTSWPLAVDGGELVIVAPMNQWHMHSWIVVVNEYVLLC